MRVVFADTGYWVALLNPHDDLHDKALNLSKAVQPAHIVTTEMILVEVLNDFSDRGEYFRQTAVNLIRVSISTQILPSFHRPVYNFRLL